MKPTIGRIVLYVLSENDADEINRRRTNPENIRNRIADKAWPHGAQAHIGNHAAAGETLPAQVVRVIEGTDLVNLTVNLDGTDTLWVTSRAEDDAKTPGTWHWMDYQKAQHAKESPPETPQHPAGPEPTETAEESGAEPDSSDSESAASAAEDTPDANSGGNYSA